MTPDKTKQDGKVGTLLKKRRSSLKLTLAQVEVATKIRGQYLVKLEADDQTLPNDIYIRGFVRSYADYLGLDGPALAQAYAVERGEAPQARQSAPRAVKAQRFVVTPRIATAGAVVVALIAIIAYLSWQFSTLAAAPKLEVVSPAADQVVFGSLVDITGNVGGGADVFVNDSPVLTDGNGHFNDKLALQDGLNVVRITAKSKLGKSSAVTRNILAHLPQVGGAQAAVPAATFEGVAVGVSIKNAATWLVVEVDGKETFRGTMLAGTSQVFQGTRNVRLTTGNAGATSFVITNKIAAGKSISPVGRDGEIKRNLDFAKETVIP
jgi:hypothetical protein